MRRQPRRHEGVSSECRRHQDKRQTIGRQHLGGRLALAVRRALHLEAVARQRQRMQRRRDEGEQAGINEIGAAPADAVEQKMRRRPAHRRGKAAGQRERGDRPPRRGAENAAERGEGGIVEVCRHRNAEHHPHANISGRACRMHDEEEAERADQRACGHGDVAAEAVDRAADVRRDEAGDQEPRREAAHGKGERPAALLGDQRQDQNRRVEDRAPGDDLRDAEHRHGAPRPGDEVAESHVLPAFTALHAARGHGLGCWIGGCTGFGAGLAAGFGLGFGLPLGFTGFEPSGAQRT